MHNMQSSTAMDLGNMRTISVQTLDVYCLGRDCHHHSVIDVSRYSDDVAVPSFGPRMRCEQCGHRGADVRPNWSERLAIGAFSGAR